MPKRKRGRPPKPDAIRTPSGQISRAKHAKHRTAEYLTRAEREAVMRTALTARARLLGVTIPETGIPTDMIVSLRQPMNGCLAGRMIRLEPDAADLWQTILDIRRTRGAYCAAIGMTDEAKLQQALKPNSEFPPDAEPVDPPSLASEEERHRHAVDAWDAMSARIYAVHPMAVRYILAVVVRDEAMHGDLPLAHILREMAK